MLKCNGKIFMNLQEAVQWLLNNNALFFMCNENYAADTEISLEELVNPSPANPKIGSLVLFADGNIAAITGITDDSFIVGSDAINIRLEKTVTYFELSGNHIIVHYSDGTSDDLGDIFAGDVDIGGVLTATEAKILEKITDKDSHVRFIEGAITRNNSCPFTFTYAKWSLSGTHLMIVIAGTINAGTTLSDGTPITNAISVPQWILDKIYPVSSTTVENKATLAYKVGAPWVSENLKLALNKGSDLRISNISGNQTFSNDDAFRMQFDLLIDDE